MWLHLQCITKPSAQGVINDVQLTKQLIVD